MCVCVCVCVCLTNLEGCDLDIPSHCNGECCVIYLPAWCVTVVLCLSVAHMKKLAASVKNDDSSIAALQEDERRKLNVNTLY